jgi:hypothetical protein
MSGTPLPMVSCQFKENIDPLGEAGRRRKAEDRLALRTETTVGNFG